MKTIAEQLIQLNQIKSDIRQAIISKGVQVAETDGLAVFASKIAAINAIIPTISFTIKLGTTTTTYQAEDSMTWEDWVNSEYNTGNYSVFTGDDTLKYITKGNSGQGAVMYGQDFVRPGEAIITNGVYHSYGGIIED